MKNAFVFVETKTSVEPTEAGGELGDIVKTIVARAVVVKTPAMIGSGAVLGETIVTSLFLVGNFTMVDILLCKGKQMPAFVSMRDVRNNLAKLEPAGMRGADDIFRQLAQELGRHRLTESGPRAIGDPLIVSNSRRGIPHIKLASMCYASRVDECFEESWKIDSNLPRGLMGSAVWDETGALKGLALAAMVAPPEMLTDAAVKALSPEALRKRRVVRAHTTGPHVYAVPAKAVLDLVETRH